MKNKIEMKPFKPKSFREFKLPKYMHGDDLKGKEHTVTISGIGLVEVWSRSDQAKVDKVVITFKEPDYKPVLCNSAKADELEKIFPDLNDTPEKIIGQKIVVHTVNEKHFGIWCNVLHFKKYVPKEKVVLNPKSDKWQSAIGSYAGGTVTEEQIRKFYTISDADMKKLIAEAEKLHKDAN